jgi:hypothetical protein
VIGGASLKRTLVARLFRLGLMLLAALLSLASTCTIGFGSPDPTPVGIQIPWIQQEQFYYCVPASIQMWALFDNPQFRVSQSTIASYVGTTSPNGTPAANVAPGVNFYTATKDASLRDAFLTSQAQFGSMQVTSINNRRPFLGVFNQQHVVVVSGGSWHSSNGWNIWDTVIYQDPASGADQELDGSTWQDNITAMVIGASATADAQANFEQYGDTGRFRGSIQHGPYQY